MENAQRLFVPFNDLQRQFRMGLTRMSRRWGWYLAVGLGLMALGFVALGESALTTLVSVSFLGWLLAFGGLVGLVHSFSYIKDGFGHFLSQFLGAALYLIAGFMLISRPGISAVTVTLILAPLFLAGGLVRIISSVLIQPPQWGWLAFSGVITAILGATIWAQWPQSGLWLIGSYVGIEMIIYGWSTTLFALALRKIPKLTSGEQRTRQVA